MHPVLHVLATAQVLEKAGQRLFRPHGLTVAQFNVLNLLSDQPEGRRASDLARALVVDASNVTGLLKRMKAEGLLRERENAADRRQHVVILTPKGQRAWEAANEAYCRSLAVVDAALSPSERKTTQRVLQKMVAAAAPTPTQTGPGPS